MNNKEFLMWIYNRLIEVHKENRNYDYMIKLRSIAENTTEPTNIWDLVKKHILENQIKDVRQNY